MCELVEEIAIYRQLKGEKCDMMKSCSRVVVPLQMLNLPFCCEDLFKYEMLLFYCRCHTVQWTKAFILCRQEKEIT